VRELPPIYDQSSGISGGVLVLVDEYDGGVTTAGVAGKAVEAIGGADMALLAGHGVFVTGVSIAAAHLRAVTLETRCRHAWQILAATGGVKAAVPDWFIEEGLEHDGTGFHGFWESAVRAELDADQSLLPTLSFGRHPDG
jgi:L-ribulose-5-phosphate 4-epimerase